MLQQRAAADTVVNHLLHTQDPIVHSPLWQLTQKGIEKQPLPYMQALNIDPSVVRRQLIAH